jgi:hypothetical protein
LLRASQLGILPKPQRLHIPLLFRPGIDTALINVKQINLSGAPENFWSSANGKTGTADQPPGRKFLREGKALDTTARLRSNQKALARP